MALAAKTKRQVYVSKLQLIPTKQMVDTVTVIKQTKIAKEGGWAKVKRGKYKGDIGQVSEQTARRPPDDSGGCVRQTILPCKMMCLFSCTGCL